MFKHNLRYYLLFKNYSIIGFHNTFLNDVIQVNVIKEIKKKTCFDLKLIPKLLRLVERFHYTDSMSF